MGWRKELRKRRKLARVRKKELYNTDAQYRAAVDEKRKAAIGSIVSAGGAIAKAIPGATSIGGVLSNMKIQNSGGKAPENRAERLAAQKDAGYRVIQTKDTTSVNEKRLIYIGAAVAAAYLFFSK